MKLDRTKSYATIYGHAVAVFEQNGTLFDGAGNPIDGQKQERRQKESVIQHTEVEKAREFLLNVLRNGALSKPVLYKVAGENNQEWDNVKDAALLLGIVKFQYQKAEMWKLPETVAEF